MRFFTSLICLLALALLGHGSLRAEPTDAVKLHKQLKASDDQLLGLLAIRWWSLIQRQPWTDTTGKFSVDAEFVSHDEEKETVTLLAFRGKGSERVVKEITVPLSKLSKQSQARAMRISRLMPKLKEKLKEKLAEVETKKKEEDSSTRVEPQIAGAMREYTARESEIGKIGGERFKGDELYGGPPIPSQRQPSQNSLSPSERPKDTPLVEGELNKEGLSGMNPYAGTKWIGRDRLVDDRRFEKPEATPQPKRPKAPVAAPPDAKPDYVVDIEYLPAEFPGGEREGWGEFYEPLGDESHLEFRVIPDKPVAGKTVKLLVIPSNAYGLPKPKTFVRIGDPSSEQESYYKSPDDGPAWAEMKLVGGRIMDFDSEEMVLLGEAEENPRRAQPGESYYLIGLKLPAGKAVLDIKLVTDSEYVGTVAFRLEEIDVATNEDESVEK